MSKSGFRIKKVNWFGDKVEREIRAAVGTGVRDAAERILEASNRIVPVDTGKLRDSGEVNVEGEKASISYDAEYAVPVHETPKAYKNGRQYKYLEKAINANSNELVNSVKDEVGKVLR